MFLDPSHHTVFLLVLSHPASRTGYVGWAGGWKHQTRCSCSWQCLNVHADCPGAVQGTPDSHAAITSTHIQGPAEKPDNF